MKPFQLDCLKKVKDVYGNEYSLFPEVLDALFKLSKENYILAVASRIEDITTAYLLLNFFNIAHYFTYIEIYPYNKSVHFKWLNLKSCIPYNQMVFYDDDVRNIRCVSKLGVHTLLVQSNIGLSYKLIQTFLNPDK
ncbi:magnesium-dependent phosphatase 1-like isoform X3 [Daktulosphaira vitifoliae]|nr:magnesium-dependent phosphatase 1-like isoform X3 [Daktulosphaira vitifoliae]XP_050539782.1 magnesium-dependent phosphatase 1-like isoform X3 [Daktulosphaira vitifoliae]